MKNRETYQQSTQTVQKPSTNNGNGKKPPSNTLAVSGAAPDPTPKTLTAEQKAEVRRTQEAIMRQHKGDVLIFYRALKVIADTRAFNPPYKRIEDYALEVHGTIPRTWHKHMNYVAINELYREYLRRKCPKGQIPADAELLNKEKCKEFEGLKRTPHHLEAAFNELTQNRQPELIAKTLVETPKYEIHLITQKHKRVAQGEREDAMTAKDIGDKFNDWFVCGDMLTSDAVKPNHFDMVITSPPYNLQGVVKYDEYIDSKSNSEYLRQLAQWCERIRYTLKLNGRACINVPNIYDKSINSSGRNNHSPYIFPLPAKLCEIMERFGDMHIYQWITWDRVFTTDAMDKHWGSYHSCAQPNVRRVKEEILIFARGSTKRKANDTLRDITEAAFKAWTYEIWQIPPDSSIHWHPCPFPLELPIRLMLLYGQRKDRILDPFGGAATTALAAAMLDRECTSIELSKKYTNLGRHRLVEYLESGKAKKRLEAILKRAENETKGKITNREGEQSEESKE